MRVEELATFINKRESIRLKKEGGHARPWTQDKILQMYRFCNMRREDDVVTTWIRSNWREPLMMIESPDLWFWMFMARLVNWPDTLEELSPMMEKGRYDSDEFIYILSKRMADGDKTWGGAYIVSTNGRTMIKHEYIAKEVLRAAWDRREEIQPHDEDSLETFSQRILKLNGVSGFMAGQIIADTKYGDMYLADAEDWSSFGISGPGSRRGLNRVLDRDIDVRWKEAEWHSTLMELKAQVVPLLKGLYLKSLCCQDLQNTLCEFDKYERVRLNQGRPRALYAGA